MSRRIPVATAAALALALSACGGDAGEPEPADPETTTTEQTDEPGAEESTPAEDETSPDDDGTEPADEETDAAPSEPEDDPTDNLPDFDTELASSGMFPGAGGDLLHSTVRIGQHEDFDRVVFDLIGTGNPEYEVQYVEEPTQQGSGRPVEVDGDAVLEVTITNTRYPEEGEEYPGGPGTYEAEQAEVVEEVRLEGTFEGHTQGFIGVEERSPFRVFTLEDPVRVVVDVQH